MNHTWEFSALGLALALRQKKITPREMMMETRDRIRARNPAINGLVWQQDDGVLERELLRIERALRQPERAPPFCGVPLPIKDLADVAGWPGTMGSRACRHRIASVDNQVISRFKDAGFWLWGRSNSAEFGTLPVTENLAYGATRNPWQLDHTAGGSSGGAAALVAAGIFPLAHGSDGGGSIRIPAACCHLVGLKPSRGRVPKGPLISDVLHGFATDGVLTRTVTDTAALLDVMAWADPAAWYAAPPPATSYLQSCRTKPPRLRIGYTIAGPLSVPCAPVHEEAVAATAKTLASLGHDVREVSLPWPMRDTLGHDFIRIWRTGTAYTPPIDWSEAEPLNQKLRDQAQRQSSLEYMESVIRLQVFSRQVVAWWGKEFDLLLLPVIAIETPKIGWMFETGLTEADDLLWRASEMAPFTGWVNVTGQPAISLPTHWHHGMPVGTQLVAPPFREDLLLAVSQELQDVYQWHKTPVPEIL